MIDYLTVLSHITLNIEKNYGLITFPFLLFHLILVVRQVKHLS